eukprot:64211-Pyramimonas_sp.AAC.1
MTKSHRLVGVCAVSKRPCPIGSRCRDGSVRVLLITRLVQCALVRLQTLRKLDPALLAEPLAVLALQVRLGA